MAQYDINFSTNASKTAQEIQRVQDELTKVIKVGQNIKLNLDTSSLSKSINTTFGALNKEINDMQRKLSKLQIGGKKFPKISATLGFREGQRERGELIAEQYRLRGQARSFEQGSNVRLQKELQALKIEASQIAPNTIEWVRFQQQISQINLELQRSDKLANTIQLRENLGAFSPGSLAQLETKLSILKGRAREISPNTSEWRKLDKEIQSIEGSINKVNKRPLSLGQRAGAAGGAFLYGGGLGGGVGSALGGITGGLVGGVPGAFTGAAIGQAVDNLGQYAAAIAKTVAEVNKSKIALAGVTRDVKDYDKAIAAVTQASQNFLLPISQATGQFAKLQASVVGAGFSTETTVKAFNGVAAAVIATGGSTEDLNSALRATAQVFSKGKVSAEELRQQIGERIPGAFTIAAQAINKTPQELDKALQDGKVTLEDFVKFVEELGKRYGSTAEILSKAPENAGPRLAVALEQASMTFGSFFQRVGAGFQGYISDLLDFAQQNEEQIKTVIASFAVLGQDIYNILSGVVEALAPVFSSFFGYIFENFARGVNALARLAKEARGAAGGPERRAAAAVEALYPNPVERALKGASAYREALAVELGYDKQAESRDSRLQGLKNTLFKEFKPTSFGAGLGRPVSTSGMSGGGGAAGRKGAKPKTYVSDISKELQRELQQRTNNIRQDASLSDREREIQEAALRYRYELLINKAEYNQAVADEGKQDILNREGYLKDLEKKLKDENELSRQAYEDVVTSPLREMLAAERDAIAELTVENKMLADGRTELTQVERRQIDIKKALKGLDEEELKAIQPLIDEILKYAGAIDTLTASQKALKAERGVAKTIQDLQIESGRLSPLEQDRLRQQIRFQEQLRDAAEAGASSEQVDRIAAAQAAIPAAGSLEEEVLRIQGLLRDMVNTAAMVKGAANTIGNAFSEAFKGIISGSMTAQEALAGFFQSVGNAFADMAAQMIQKMIQIYILDQFLKILPGAAGAFTGDASIKGGGFGSFSGGDFSAGGVPDLPGLGGTGALADGGGIPSYAGIKFANGGIAMGGFTAFANGGMVTGPTMGLVGEGRYNEAIVPLPNGKSIPVELGGAAGNQMNTNIVVNVNNGQAQSNATGSNSSELGRKIEGAVKQVIVGELRPGGLLAR